MPYRPDSIEARFLAGDLEIVARVVRWIALVLAAPRFWALREEWLDLHQEVMGRVLESLRQERFDAAKDLRAYVQAVARYTALQALSTRRRLFLPRQAVAPRIDEAPAADESAISQQLVRQVLEHASDGCRDLLKAYFYDQKNYAEIADSLGVPIGTVKSRLARCLESAQRAMERGRKKPGGKLGPRPFPDPR